MSPVPFESSRSHPDITHPTSIHFPFLSLSVSTVRPILTQWTHLYHSFLRILAGSWTSNLVVIVLPVSFYQCKIQARPIKCEYNNKNRLHACGINLYRNLPLGFLFVQFGGFNFGMKRENSGTMRTENCRKPTNLIIILWYSLFRGSYPGPKRWKAVVLTARLDQQRTPA